MTKAIILAAGMGTRLGSSLPKPLTPLNKSGTTFLQHQIKHLLSYDKVEEIIVVVGHEAGQIKTYVAEHFPTAPITFVHNPAYASTNTSKSLLLALEGLSCNVLTLNGDIIFDRHVLSLLLSSKPSCLSVLAAQCGDEEVKYRLTDNCITALGKQITGGEGEAVGINYLAAADLPVIREYLLGADAQEYYEDAYAAAIAEGVLTLRACPVDDYMVMEVDFPEDLVTAKNLMVAKE